MDSQSKKQVILSYLRKRFPELYVGSARWHKHLWEVQLYSDQSERCLRIEFTKVVLGRSAQAVIRDLDGWEPTKDEEAVRVTMNGVFEVPFRTP